MTAKRALVTGGSRGIGAAIAKKLGEDGLHVIINYRSSTDAAEAVKRAMKKPGNKISCSGEELYSKFEKWFVDAKKYNITREADVQLYLELCLVNKELAAEEKPRWMLMVLRKKSISGDKKMQRIVNGMKENPA